MSAIQARGGLYRAKGNEQPFPNILHPRKTIRVLAFGRTAAGLLSPASRALSCKAMFGGVGAGSGGRNVNGYRITGEDDDDSGNGGFNWVMQLAFFTACSAVCAPPAKALLKKKKKSSKSDQMIDEYSDRLVNLAWPIAQNLGFSGAIGFMTGLALKVIGSAVAIALGMIFIIIQGGVYLGYIEVKWNEVHKEVIKRLDVNKDGKFDASDAKSLGASGLAVLSQGVPSVGGFLAGFALALR